MHLIQKGGGGGVGMQEAVGRPSSSLYQVFTISLVGSASLIGYIVHPQQLTLMNFSSSLLTLLFF